MSSSDSELRIKLDDDHGLTGSNEVVLTFDPFAVVRVKVRSDMKTRHEAGEVASTS